MRDRATARSASVQDQKQTDGFLVVPNPADQIGFGIGKTSSPR
jgi:hypothetical protein